MSEDTDFRKESVEERFEHLAFHIVDLFTEALVEAAEKSGGSLTVANIRTIEQAFKTVGAEDVRRRFHDKIESCLLARRSNFSDGPRRRPFERLLTHRFSNLFPDHVAEGELLDTPVSRRMLQGFFQAIEMMIGEQLWAQCHTACVDILEAREKAAGGPVEWKDFYAHPSANRLLEDVLVVASRHFKDFERRAEWFLELINSHLESAEDYDFEGDGVEEWRLERSGMLAVLLGLYEPFRDHLAQDGGRAELVARYGEPAVEMVEDLLEILNQGGSGGEPTSPE